MVYKLISFGVRAGLAGGFIYWTKEEGLWSDAKTTTELYQRTYTSASNLLRESPIQIPTISVPKPTEIGAFLRVNWNKAMYGLFDGIQAAPSKIQEWSVKGYESVQKALDAPPAVEEAAK